MLLIGEGGERGSSKGRLGGDKDFKKYRFLRL
jgi:hypothetical protein